jgi:uncharacterized cupredoxin-like copper-binding protein
VALGVLALGVTSVGLACGDDDDDDDGGGEVDVTLSEWEVIPRPESVDAGAVTFVVKNNGPDDPHEMVVFKTDLDPGDLPTRDDGGVDEEGAGVELIGEIEEFDPGNTETATFTLSKGSYVLLCNVVEDEDGETESHYAMGMRHAFEVN